MAADAIEKNCVGRHRQLQLKEQCLTVDSVPAKDQLVQLRANSNISTGGDSIDMTDQMHPSYKALAVGITKAMGAAVCGVGFNHSRFNQTRRAAPAILGRD